MAKILQVCNTDFYLNRFLKPLVIELRNRGHEVSCLCTGVEETVDLRSRGITTYNFDFPNTYSPFAFLVAILKMVRFLKLHEFDLVNSHNRNSSIVTRIACWIARVKISVYTAHGFYFHDDQKPLARKLTEILEWQLAHITDYTLSQSDEDTQFSLKKGTGPRGGVHTIGNGIDTKKFCPKADLASGDHFRIAAIGRLVEGKGFEDLLQAFALVCKTIANAELTIIGGNIPRDLHSNSDKISKLILDLGIKEKVKITGIVNNVEDFLQNCDVFVHPSYREGMPRSLLEAMCMARVCIASRIRGAREILRENENGLLYSPRNYNELAEKLLYTYRLPLDQKRALGQKARTDVLEKFDEVDYTRKQVSLLEKFINTSIQDGDK